jgi:protein-tyrosine-phosphatase
MAFGGAKVAQTAPGTFWEPAALGTRLKEELGKGLTKKESMGRGHVRRGVDRFRCLTMKFAPHANGSPGEPRARTRANHLRGQHRAQHDGGASCCAASLDRRGADGKIEIRSAGIAPYARDGALVSLDTRMALRAIGIDIGEEATSTDLKRHPELLEAADLVIAMTAQQERDLRERFPAAARRPAFTLRAFAGEAGDIDDPFEQGHEIFDVCRDEIGRLIPRVADRLLGGE